MKAALISAAYSGSTPTGDTRTELQKRQLINRNGFPTPLGRALADALLHTRKDIP